MLKFFVLSVCMLTCLSSRCQDLIYLQFDMLEIIRRPVPQQFEESLIRRHGIDSIRIGTDPFWNGSEFVSTESAIYIFDSSGRAIAYGSSNNAQALPVWEYFYEQACPVMFHISDSIESEETYSCDDEGRIMEISNPVVRETYKWNPDGRVKQYESFSLNKGKEVYKTSAEYFYADDGKLTEVKESEALLIGEEWYEAQKGRINVEYLGGRFSKIYVSGAELIWNNKPPSWDSSGTSTVEVDPIYEEGEFRGGTYFQNGDEELTLRLQIERNPEGLITAFNYFRISGKSEEPYLSTQIEYFR